MAELIAAVFNWLLALAMIAALSAPVYALLSIPGVVASLLVQRLLRGHPNARESVTALTAALSLAPMLIMGHSPVILPLPFGVWLALHMGQANAVWMAAASISITFLGVMVISRRSGRTLVRDEP